MKRSELKRRTPLRSKAAQKKGRKLPAHSSAQKVRAGILVAWRRHEREAVHRRLYCQARGCTRPGTDCHHPFGRLNEPWASFSEATVILCRGHHEEVTGKVGTGLNVALRDRMRWLALERTRAYIDQELARMRRRHTVVWMDSDEEALPRRWRYVTEVADLNGIAPPNWRELLQEGKR